MKYEEGEGHKIHVDESDFTLNVCLGTKFTGKLLACLSLLFVDY